MYAPTDILFNLGVWQLVVFVFSSTKLRTIFFVTVLLNRIPFVSVFISGNILVGTAVAQWLKCCATNRKVAGSIPAGVGGFFIDI